MGGKSRTRRYAAVNVNNTITAALYTAVERHGRPLRCWWATRPPPTPPLRSATARPPPMRALGDVTGYANLATNANTARAAADINDSAVAVADKFATKNRGHFRRCQRRTSHIANCKLSYPLRPTLYLIWPHTCSKEKKKNVGSKSCPILAEWVSQKSRFCK